ncbi:uncharacterized protein LOC111624528 isoform X1 [Centruroides sculpturatus]|uniref:uncharacterized protein LOC111624528 isoform X1 n=1 Tax=Centruroides sculpturatus TaxID=218467 RepID=UPI000C6E1DC6|nr:uncharacterized protein LOC111624528 isoform X1 [Centruroides sculpturatus]
MLEAVRSDDRRVSAPMPAGGREAEEPDGTLLHSILTEGPSAVYRPPSDGSDPSSPADLENGIDFGYSQKFFHIADGNLYSVFSPLQGRSYGGKPSFLRKQQCVVRESQGRGRKNPKRGLKFHNFLPSESITSEKEDKSLSGEGEIWKVHAECRLREEHGTKQIMVSNWSVSEGNASDPRHPEDPSVSPAVEALRAVRLDRGPGPSFSSKGTELNAIVDRLGSAPRSIHPTELRLRRPCPSPKSSSRAHKSPGGCTAPRGSRRKRRKPLRTRKVVPYHQYLSMLEDDQAAPLDLSRRSLSPSSEDTEGPAPSDLPDGVPPPATASEDSQRLSDSAEPMGSSVSMGIAQIPVYPCPVRICIRPVPVTVPDSSRRVSVTPPETPTGGTKTRSTLPSSQGWETGVRAPGDADDRRGTPRPKARSNQRTIIRKKLEDTFRQNGFLVKTKQVSDGEATFCKFRQLKKYTRYYLKSWQDHLPEEVHKLWKGFLPPKTAIPANGAGKREECKAVAE